MSARLTLSQVMPDVAEALNLQPYSVRSLRYTNRAQEELLNKGRWVGTLIRYRIQIASGFVTWPRSLQTIEALEVNGHPTGLRNQWFEFLDFGSREMYREGYRHAGSDVAIDMAEAISFADIDPRGNPKRLKVYASSTEDAKARILLQFYDASGNYIRSNDATEGWVDGEFVAINATTPQSTINTVGSWVGVQKPCTNGSVRITELDTVTGLERTLALYEHDETNPAYRRTKISHLPCDRLEHDRLACVTAVGDQRFIPAKKPRDYMMLQSSSAIVEMVRSIYKRENNQVGEAQTYESKAVEILDDQLGKWIGVGALQVPQFDLAFGMANGPQGII